MFTVLINNIDVSAYINRGTLPSIRQRVEGESIWDYKTDVIYCDLDADALSVLGMSSYQDLWRVKAEVQHNSITYLIGWVTNAELNHKTGWISCELGSVLYVVSKLPVRHNLDDIWWNSGIDQSLWETQDVGNFKTVGLNGDEFALAVTNIKTRIHGALLYHGYPLFSQIYIQSMILIPSVLSPQIDISVDWPTGSWFGQTYIGQFNGGGIYKTPGGELIFVRYGGTHSAITLSENGVMNYDYDLGGGTLNDQGQYVTNSGIVCQPAHDVIDQAFISVISFRAGYDITDEIINVGMINPIEYYVYYASQLWRVYAQPLDAFWFDYDGDATIGDILRDFAVILDGIVYTRIDGDLQFTSRSLALSLTVTDDHILDMQSNIAQQSRTELPLTDYIILLSAAKALILANYEAYMSGMVERNELKVLSDEFSSSPIMRITQYGLVKEVVISDDIFQLYTEVQI